MGQYRDLGMREYFDCLAGEDDRVTAVQGPDDKVTPAAGPTVKPPSARTR
jgi:hypothetical protein